MSRSNPTADPILNPSKRWFQWDSTSCKFKYYDKELPNPKDASKKGANVFVPLPFQFLVLDVLTTVGGFSDADQSSFYGNEVRNYAGSTKAEILEVKVKGKTVLSGTWESIKDKAEAMDCKFANSVYIGYFDENKQLQLGNIKLFGAPIGSWIEISGTIQKSGRKVSDCAFKVATTKTGKKGSVTWNEPVFEEIKTKPETNEKANALDVTLQDYLKQYFNKTTEPVSVAEEAVEQISSTPATDLLMDNSQNEVITSTNSTFVDEDF